MSDGFHPPIEEYLEAIHALEEEGVAVIQARLAERLGYARPSVSEMVRRLRADGYVEVAGGAGRAVNLTPAGRARAESVVRKHRLAERLLTDVIGLDWHKAHLEAGRWEHVISDEVEARLIALLENPSTCPHGNPIPGSGQPRPVLSALAEASPGDHVRLERVTEQVEIDIDALAYLSEHHFVPGTDAQVRARAPDGTLTLVLDGEDEADPTSALSLSPALAQQLFVARA